MGEGCGAFDLICHIAFDSPLVTRRQRADKAKSEIDFSEYSEQARAVLDALLDKYASEGIEELETLEILKVPPLTSLGTPIEIVKAFGGKGKYLNAVNQLKSHLYKPTAA
jgi:type I restriction enzyme R subunit